MFVHIIETQTDIETVDYLCDHWPWGSQFLNTGYLCIVFVPLMVLWFSLHQTSQCSGMSGQIPVDWIEGFFSKFTSALKQCPQVQIQIFRKQDQLLLEREAKYRIKAQNGDSRVTILSSIWKEN